MQKFAVDGAVEERRTRPVDRAAVWHLDDCGKDVDRKRKSESRSGTRWFWV